MTRYAPLCLALALASLGCSDSVNNGGSDASVTSDAGGGATVTADTLVTELSSAICRAYFNCPAVGDSALVQVLTRDALTCTSRVRTVSDIAFADVVAQIRAGRARLDPAAARRCIDALASSCTSEGDLTAVCNEAVTGTVTEGQGCWRAFDCSPGLYCDHGTSSARACPGVCRAKKQPGAPCEVDRECSAASDATPTCFNGQCASLRAGAPAAEGAACGVISAGGTDALSVGCASGFACVRNAAGAGASACRRILNEGSPCESGDPCAVGTACAASAGTTTRTCRQIPTAMAGEACRANGFPLCNPFDRLECGAAMTCVSTGPGTQGGRCRRGDFYSAVSCDAGLYCRGSDSTCQPRLAVGAECGEDRDCASNECESGRCLERPCD